MVLAADLVQETPVWRMEVPKWLGQYMRQRSIINLLGNRVGYNKAIRQRFEVCKDYGLYILQVSPSRPTQAAPDPAVDGVGTVNLAETPV